MFRTQRRTAMKVRNGRVQRKNLHAKTPHYFHTEMASLVIDRLRPGFGCRHVVRKEHVRRFLPLLPDWDELSLGLNAIVLADGNSNCMGWHRPGVVAICAWDREIEWHDCYQSFFKEHVGVFEALAIPYDVGVERISVRFTEATARAFSLVHVLVHELGHHHDRMTTRSKRESCRGEAYAENYSCQFQNAIVQRYRKEFGDI
jgi:hypothetical protein